MSTGDRPEPVSSSDTAAKLAVLAAGDRRVRDALARAEAIPFLGHHAPTEREAAAIPDQLASGRLELVKRLRDLFVRWNALTAAWIAGRVARDYGSVSQTELWPHLERLFGGPLAGDDRRRLGEWFRAACRRLDLPVAEAGGAVDGFVLQAGVPEAHAAAFAEAMLKAERRRGLPDPDDEPECADFSRSASMLVQPGQVRLGRILGHDLTGAYGRLWARLREDERAHGDDAFVRRIREALAERGAGSGAERRPQLLWRDAMPALRLPPGAGQRWTVEAGGARLDITGEARPLVVALPEAGAAGPIRWRRAGPGGAEGEIPLLADRDDVLVFSPEGRLVGRGRLGAPSPLHLPRGTPLLVARRPIRCREAEAEPAAVPGLAALPVRLEDEPVEVGHGPAATLVLAPTRRPEVAIEGHGFADLAGRRIHLALGMVARVAWPAFEAADAGQAGQAYALRVELADGSELEYDLPDPRRAEVPIGEELGGLRPGLRAVRAALVRAGERRPLARAAALAWVGISGFDGRRFRGAPPGNLRSAEGASADDHGVVIDAPETRPVATLEFADTDGQGRGETLAFPRPGASLRLVWFDPEGRRRAEPVAKGATVMVRPGDSRLLEITCSDAAARLVVAGRDRGPAFAERPVATIALAALADMCKGREPVVAAVAADGVPLDLLRLVLPAEVRGWRRTLDRERGEPALHLAMREPIEAVELRARDLWGGGAVDLALAPDGLRRSDPATGASARLEVEVGAPRPAVRLVLEQDRWPPGFWLIDLEVRSDRDGGLVRPTNHRGDVFALLLDHDPADERGRDLARPGLDDALPVFERLHEELQRCYADQCWQGDLDALGRLWRRLARTLASAPEGVPWDRLLPLAFLDPPAEAAGSWLPPLSLWHAFQNTMALPAPAYAALANVLRDDARVLSELAAVADAGGPARHLFRGGRLARDFFLNFANVAEVSSAGGVLELADFDWPAYRRAMLDGIAAGPPWWSVEDELLGAAHHLEAAEALERRYRRLVDGSGNLQRVQGASTLAAAAARWADRHGRQALRPFLVEAARGGGAALAVVPPVFGGEEADAFLATALAGLSGIALACRLEPRIPGTWDRLLAELARDGDRERALGSLHFLASAGPESLALHLLLWETILATGDPCKT